MKTIEEFIKLFELPFDKFYDPTAYTDGTYGFSFYSKMDEQGNSSLYSIIIDKDSLDKEIIPLRIRVSYGKKTEDGLRLNTGKIKTSSPVDLTSINEIFYDQKQELFLTKKRWPFSNQKKNISPNELIKKIDYLHRKSTKKIRGAKLRLKIGIIRILIPKTLELVYKSLIKILLLISGEKLKEDIFLRNLELSKNESNPSSNIKTKNNEYDSSDKSQILGIKISKRTLITFATIHLIIALPFYWCNYYPKIVVAVTSNNFVLILYVVLGIEVIESVIPKLLKLLIDLVAKKHNYYSFFKKIKV